MSKASTIVIIVIAVLSVSQAVAQETVFALLKSDKKRADEYFEEKNFENALRYYSAAAKGPELNPVISLQIAESNFHLKKYRQAIHAYEAYLTAGHQLPQSSRLKLAESHASLGEYTKAVGHLREYLKESSDDGGVLKKVWQFTNIRFLYEDSAHFAVRPLKLNSRDGELQVMPFENGFLFLSNRKETRVVEKIDGITNKPFYRLYFARAFADSSLTGSTQFGRPSKYTQAAFKFHEGPFAFYGRGKKMVVTMLDKQSGLAFAEREENNWKVVSEFPFNSKSYSITDPSINEDGTVLYFASDMPGGFGGKDLYRSMFQNGRWTKPENLGETVNTTFDEIAPYLYQGRTLYFSSTGQPGMGGLDIFKAEVLPEGFDEPKNLGYPLNTSSDDFGISLDAFGRKGWFTSNRVRGEFDDDLFEFDMDLQVYPLVIDGTLRFKESSISDSASLQNFGRAKLYVIDAIRNTVVFEHSTDENGKFEITIPYFSLYKIRVVGEDQHENIVSLELPKHRTEHTTHDIVVVKDVFKSPDK